MKYTVTMKTVNVEYFDVEAEDEYEAVSVIHEMFNEGELDYEHPSYDITFTCGAAKETDWIESMI